MSSGKLEIQPVIALDTHSITINEIQGVSYDTHPYMVNRGKDFMLSDEYNDED